MMGPVQDRRRLLVAVNPSSGRSRDVCPLAVILRALPGGGRPIDAMRVSGAATAVWVVGAVSAGFGGLVSERTNSLRFPRGRSRRALAVVGS